MIMKIYGEEILEVLPIHKPSTLDIKDLKIDYVLLSIPSLSSSKD